jgi:hypothetical protein
VLFRARVLEERPVPYLNAVAMPSRQAAQETAQGAEVGGAEGRRQLNPQGVGPRSQGLDCGQEGTERFGDVGQAALTGAPSLCQWF